MKEMYHLGELGEHRKIRVILNGVLSRLWRYGPNSGARPCEHTNKFSTSARREEFLHCLNAIGFLRRTLSRGEPSGNKMEKKKEVSFYFAVWPQ